MLITTIPNPISKDGYKQFNGFVMAYLIKFPKIHILLTVIPLMLVAFPKKR